MDAIGLKIGRVWIGLAFSLLTLPMLAANHSATVLCDTPVYRYAMYRWNPAPFILCRIHDGPDQDKHAPQVRKAVETASSDPSTPANVIWIDVDASEVKQFETLPPLVRERWQNRAKGTTSTYYLVSSHGVIVDEHPWTVAEINDLLDSPARRRIGEELELGKAGVIVLLDQPGKPDVNDAAAATIQQSLAKIAGGEIELATAPSVDKPETGFIRLSKDSQNDAWLVRQLLEVESDLATVDEPIAFMVFGRGRALFSCLGKGITTENLARDVEFLSGACSCTVKEQNPGVDLLMRYDWETAATVLAEKYGGEEGADALLDGDQLFPALALPVDSEEKEKSEVTDASLTEEPKSTTNDKTAADPEVNVQQTANSDTTGNADSKKSVAMRTPPSSDKSNDESVTVRIGLWRVAAGLGVALIGLFAATWLVLRPRG